VLMDAGNGQFGAATAGHLLGNLATAGIDPGAVNAVIISHFHSDHISGLRGKDGALTYPNAEGSVSTCAYSWAIPIVMGYATASLGGMKRHAVSGMSINCCVGAA
jgi:mRNA degradation ribonuclease J1/J2